MKIAWMSDIHLNFLEKEERQEFYHKIKGDLAVISGDIGESQNIVQFIKEMEEAVKIPVYFVLGNHDYYCSSFKKVIKTVTKLNYLPKKYYVPLNDSTALLGVDGWGDCRNGNYEHSRLTMSDWLYIEELNKGYLKGPVVLKQVLQEVADRDARKLKRKVNKAIKDGYKKLIIVTHVPPFKDACYNAGKKSESDGLPFFSSKILGDSILPIAKKNPEVDFLWLCGHTHSRVTYHPRSNMVVKVAESEYYRPQIEEILNV